MSSRPPGGVRSPQADDGDACDLAPALAPDVVVLVADAGLGTINSVRLTMDALTVVGGDADRPPVVVVLNHYDRGHEIHRRNLEWLSVREGYRIVTLPGAEDALADLSCDRGGRIQPDPGWWSPRPPRAAMTTSVV